MWVGRAPALPVRRPTRPAGEPSAALQRALQWMQFICGAGDPKLAFRPLEGKSGTCGKTWKQVCLGREGLSGMGVVVVDGMVGGGGGGRWMDEHCAGQHHSLGQGTRGKHFALR